MPNATGPAVATWVRSCIDHTITERFSLILEGTFRDPDVVAATLRRFVAAGYHTQAVVLAARPERSRLDCLLRSLGASTGQAARWTPPTVYQASRLSGSGDLTAPLARGRGGRLTSKITNSIRNLCQSRFERLLGGIFGWSLTA
jgi:UDP-N-acetylglucosamine kinase